MDVSIIIPTIRPQGAARCLRAIEESCGVRLCEMTEFSSFSGRRYLFDGSSDDVISAEVLVLEDTAGIGCPRMVASLTDWARGDHVLFLGDDTIPQPGFLRAALDVMAEFRDDWGLVGLNDGVHEGRFATHWLASKRLLKHLPGGQFFHTGYRHCFCDQELTDVAYELGRYAYAPAARIVHDHPHVTGAPSDDGYKRAYDPDSYRADQALYRRRKIERNRARGGKLGVAFPLVDGDVPAPFFVSVLRMMPERYTMLFPRFPAGKFCDSIASVRNDLVEQALEAGCTHLAMLDTDQVYPPDALTCLLAHDKPVVGAAVHRRWPPFDLILLRGEPGAYTHVPESECYSGELVPVDATGTGCLVFDMRVFLDLPGPWFGFDQVDGKPVGEDIAFCAKARAAGIEIYVDTSVEVEHLTRLRVNRAVRELYRVCNRHEFAPADGGQNTQEEDHHG